MKTIKGKHLRKLGFKKEAEEPTLDPEGRGYHYYTYEVGKNCLLISCSNDERIDGGYVIEFFEIMGLKIKDLGVLKKLVKLLKSINNG